MQVFKLCFLLFSFFLIESSFAQCTPSAPAVSACSGGNGAGSNGVNINGGQTFWFTGGPTTWASGINLNGGIFRVCGTLTLSSLSLNSGTIIIESGGSLRVNLGGDLFLNGNSSICNRGTFNLNTNLRMQNANNTVWNLGASATFSVVGQIEINSSTSKLINNGGNITAGSIVVQGSASAGAVCIQAGSCITFNGGSNSIVNSFTNGWAFSGAGIAAITYNGNAVLNNAFTANSNVIICGNAGATSSGGGGWGAATLTITPCPNCGVALPIELLYFKTKNCDEDVCFSWATATETSNKSFTIEQSETGMDFQTLKILPGGGTTTSKIEYNQRIPLTDIGSSSEVLYFRLKQTDFSGEVSYSPITSFSRKSEFDKIKIFPNPFNEELRITNRTCGQIEILNNTNVLLKIKLPANNDMLIQTSMLPPGIYIVLIKNESGLILESRKLVKKQ